MKSFLFACLCMSLMSTGCVHVGDSYDLYIDKTTLGQKEGRASTYTVLWLAGWGDSGVSAAAKNSEITTVNHMDKEVTMILFGLYMSQTTVVYGD